MTLQKVHAGMPFKPSAELRNRTIDMLSSWNAGNSEGTPGNRWEFYNSTIVHIKNVSGTDIGRFYSMGLDGDLVFETDESVKNRAFFKGVVPQKADHETKYVVTIEPIPNGEIGRAVISGAVHAYIDNGTGGDADVEYVSIKDGSSVFEEDSGGTARILWRKSLAAGIHLAIIRFPVVIPCGFWARITGDITYDSSGDHWESWQELEDDADTVRPGGITGDSNHQLIEVNGIEFIPNTDASSASKPNKDTVVWIHSFQNLGGGKYLYYFSWEGQGTWENPYPIHMDPKTADGLSWDIEAKPAGYDGTRTRYGNGDFTQIDADTLQLDFSSWNEDYDSQGNRSEIHTNDNKWVRFDVSNISCGGCC